MLTPRERAGFERLERAELAAIRARSEADRLQREAASIFRAIEGEYLIDEVFGRKLREYNGG